MASFNNLPPSILLLVLAHLDPESRLSATLASRAWYLATRTEHEVQAELYTQALFACPGWEVTALSNPFFPSLDGLSDLDTIAVEYTKKPLIDSVNIANWRETCANAILTMPNLKHFSATLPHLLNPATEITTADFTTLDTAGFLFHRLASHGRELKVTIVTHVQYVPSTNISRPSSASLASIYQTLTFIARPSVEPNTPRLLCPELEAAESALRGGDLSLFGPSASYTSARRTIDHITSLAHLGYIPIKRKPRPMPEWKTFEQLQDERDGPPRWPRKAKRAVLGFLGSFEAPGTDRLGPGRDRRDFEGGRRPGWDGRSMAGRVLQGR